MGLQLQVGSSDRDPLTGLIGRQEFLQQMRRQGGQDREEGVFGRFTLVYFNLLNFKLYNLTFGQEAGDDCLLRIAQILQKEFEGEQVARFSDDHFAVLTKRTDLVEAITQIYHQAGDANQHINAGIRYIDESVKEGSEGLVCDQAKIACDSIKKEASKYYAIYSEELRNQLERNTYIIENLDQAISKGYIQVYFQPVIRALTGKLCSVEALTRWVDPLMGLMSPAVFIPVLEEAHLLHKLDTFVMQEVGRILRNGIDVGAPITPVSFNLSRTDFILCNPFEELEKIVQKYKLQRDLLCVEITESVLMSNTALVSEEIRKFREAGYEVWMDDFGSGYSSLNTLKEFAFDEIKIDMLFLRNLDERGKQIISTIVDMAKKLHIHTLAEGAETKEQVDFLREIGCEKIQGYYYGRPQPIEDMAKHMVEEGIPSESRTEAQMYDRIGELNVITDKPVAIFSSDGTELQMLYCNKAYQEVLDSIGGRSEEELNDLIDKPNFALFKKFQDFTRRVVSSSEEETLYYIDNGQKLRLKARNVVNDGSHCLIQASLENITYVEGKAEVADVDKTIRNLMTLYHVIYELNPAKDTITLLVSASEPDEVGKAYHGILETNRIYTEGNLYEEDQERFRSFFQEITSKDYLLARKEAYRCIWVRVRQMDGNYKWMEFVALILKDEDYKVLIFMKDAAIEDADDKEQTLRRIMDSNTIVMEKRALRKADDHTALWDTLMQTTVGMYFWKDTNRRFQGASKSFLHYFGLSSLEELLGKTDEEMGWHVDRNQFQDDEERVLGKGETLLEVKGTCIARGRVRHIVTYRFPIYTDGKSTGLLGYFMDEDMMGEIARKVERSELIDEVTGLLNMYGIAAIGKRFYEEFRQNGRDFDAVLVNIPEISTLYDRYGIQNAKNMIRQIAKEIEEICGTNAVLARTDIGQFFAMKQLDEPGWAEEIQKAVTEKIQALREIDGLPCTLFVHALHQKASDSVSFDRLTFKMVNELMDLENEHADHLKEVSVPFDLRKFDEMDESVYMADEETHELLYINKTALHDLHLSGDYDYRGKKCYEVLMGRTTPCDDCANASLREDRFHVESYHNPVTGKDYILRGTLVPWKDRLVRFSTSTCITDVQKENEQKETKVYGELAANDVIGEALQESDPDQGIMTLLSRMGELMQADRTFIYEIRGETVKNTYLWKRNQNEEQAELPTPPDNVRALLREIYRDAQEFKVEFAENVRTDLPDLYEYLRLCKIDSMDSLPIRIGGEVIGYVGMLNPSRERLRSSGLFLSTLTRFLSIMLRNRDAYRQLDAMSHRDSLTGVMNRRAYHELQMKRTLHNRSVVIFCDVNGLKKANDTLGHEAGDVLIRNTAHAMANVVSREEIYRMGGDEFLILVENLTPFQVEEIQGDLRKSFAAEGVSVAMGAAISEGKGEKISDLVQEADAKMYENKQKMHAELGM